MVTALEFELLRLREIYAGALFYPAEQAGDVLHGWREWTGGVPEEMSSIGRLMNFPPIPEIPEPVRGKSFTVVEAVYCGDPADGQELVAPLRELGTVGRDTMAVQEPVGIAELHMDPPEPVPYWADSVMTGELPAAAIDSLLEAVGADSGSQLLVVDLRRPLADTAGRWRTRQPAGLVPRLRCKLRPYAGGDGADPRLAGCLQGCAGAVRCRSLPRLCRGALRDDAGVPARDCRPASRGQAALRPRERLPSQPPGHRLGRASTPFPASCKSGTWSHTTSKSAISL